MTTNALKTRINNHLSNIRLWKNTSVAQHFLIEGHEISKHFRVAILDNCKGGEATRIREGYWISALNTVNNGINLREESNLTMDYQTIMHARHFQHSTTCLPYFLTNLMEVRTLSLQHYKRNLLNPKRSRSASALGTRNDQSRAANSILRFLTRTVRT